MYKDDPLDFEILEGIEPRMPKLPKYQRDMADWLILYGEEVEKPKSITARDMVRAISWVAVVGGLLGAAESGIATICGYPNMNCVPFSAASITGTVVLLATMNKITNYKDVRRNTTPGDPVNWDYYNHD